MIEIADDNIYFLKSDKQNRKIDGPRTIYKVKKIDKINFDFDKYNMNKHIVKANLQGWLYFTAILFPWKGRIKIK